MSEDWRWQQIRAHWPLVTEWDAHVAQLRTALEVLLSAESTPAATAVLAAVAEAHNCINQLVNWTETESFETLLSTAEALRDALARTEIALAATEVTGDTKSQLQESLTYLHGSVADFTVRLTSAT